MDDTTPPVPPFTSNGSRYRGQKPCAWCGDLFWWHPKIRMTCCSNSCSRNLRSGGPRTRLTVTLCTQCGRPFVKRGSNTRTCSDSCREASAKASKRAHHERRSAALGLSIKGQTLTKCCRLCGRQFSVVVSTRVTGYCSDECRREAVKTDAYFDGKRAAKRRRRALERGATTERYDRRMIFERDGWRCQLCGTATRPDAAVPHPKAPTLDHIVPLAKGGSDTPANVQCAHFLCNSIKGAGVNGVGEQLRLVG